MTPVKRICVTFVLANMESTLGFFVIVLPISWIIAYPTKSALLDWSNLHTKPYEPNAVDKQVNDYLKPMLSSHVDGSTPAPLYSFQPKDFSQITDLSDLLRYFPPSLLTKNIKLGGKKGSLLQITAVKPKSIPTSKAPLTILLATKAKNKDRVNDKDERDANQNQDLTPDTTDSNTVNEGKSAEEPTEERLERNTNDDSVKKAISFFKNFKLQNVFNEVLNDSDWKEHNEDFILPNYNESKGEEEVQILDPVEQVQESNNQNDGYPKVDAGKELKYPENNFQNDDQNKIFISKEIEEALKTKAERSDHNDHGSKIYEEHGNGIRNNSYNKNETNVYKHEDEKYDQEPKNDVERNQWSHRDHHHEIRKDQEDKLYTRNDLINETVSIEHKHPDYDAKKENVNYENDENFVDDDEKNIQFKSHEHQETQLSNELKYDHQARSIFIKDDNQLNDDGESNYHVNRHGFHEKQASEVLKYDQKASNQEHEEDQENDDEKNNYQETSHEHPEKQGSSEMKQDQQERNYEHDENQEHKDEGKGDHEARSHEAGGHDVRVHVDYDQQAETNAGNNYEKLLSDNTIIRLQEALTKAEEAKNQLKSKSDECSPAELSRSVNHSEFTKKSNHDNSNAKSYTLSFLFNK